MSVSKKILTKWRKEALIETYLHQDKQDEAFTTNSATWAVIHQRILTLTQELLDQHLMRSNKKEEGQ